MGLPFSSWLYKMISQPMPKQVAALKTQNGSWTQYPVRQDWPILWVILLLAAYLRLNGLNEPGLWLDEAAYTIAAQKPIIDQITHPIETLRDSIGSADPVLSAIPFSLTLKLGFSNYLARFPAALFGILSVAIFYRLGRVLFGNTVGLIAALLLCTSSFHLLYSQEARSYSQLAFFSLVSFYFLYLTTTRTRLSDWALYTVSVWAGISSHYAMTFSIFTQGVFLATLFLQTLFQPDHKAKTLKAFLKHWAYFLSAVGIVFLARLPWLEDFLYWSSRTVGGPYPLDLSGNFIHSIQALIGPGWIILGICAVLSLLGLTLAFYHNKRATLLLACWLIFSIPVTTIGLWYVSQFFHERHVIWSLPGLLLATACGLVGLGYLSQKLWLTNISAPKARLAQLALIGLVVVPLLFISLKQAQQNLIMKQNWPVGQLQAATSYIATQAQGQEVVIGVPNAQYLQLYIQPIRQDLIYLDANSTTLPAKFEGAWYVFYGVQDIPTRWTQQVDFKKFNDLVVVHRPGPCPIEVCINDTKLLFAEMAEANPGSLLGEKLNSMVSGLANLSIQ